MIITLYKNCILTNSYSEVFHHSVLEDYLYSLDKISYEIDGIYQVNSGVFNIDFDNSENYSVYEYNYMKVQDNNFIRYCFIDSIEIGNEIARIYYSEDIWASYSSVMTIRDSWLSRSRILEYGTNNSISLYNLPLEYDGNNPLFETKLEVPSQEGYSLILQVQVYDSQSYGASSERYCFSGVIYKKNTDLTHRKRVFNSIEEVRNICESIIKYQAKNIFYTAEGRELNWYFQVDNITIIPNYLLNESLLFSTYFTQEIETDTSSSTTYIKEILRNNQQASEFSIFRLKENYLDNVVEEIAKRYTIANNFNNFSIGTYTGQYNLINNGKSKLVYLKTSWTNYNFDIYLCYDNNMIKITNDFVLNVPFESLLGEEQAQRKLTRELSNVNGIATIASGGIDIFSSNLSKFATNQYSSVTGLTKTGRLSNSRINRIKRNVINERQAISSLQESSKGVNSIISGVSSLIETNQANYSSTKGTFTTSDAFLNAKYGICLRKITPSNTQEVQNMIENTGYITYYFANNEVLGNYGNNYSYNVIKFDFVKLFGLFPQDINEQLKEILLNGFKIYYTGNL